MMIDNLLKLNPFSLEAKIKNRVQQNEQHSIVTLENYLNNTINSYNIEKQKEHKKEVNTSKKTLNKN